MRIKIPIIIALTVCGIYVVLNAPFGKHKLYGYGWSRAISLEVGCMSATISESDFPYELAFQYSTQSEVDHPEKLFLNNVILRGCDSGSVLEFGNHSAYFDGYRLSHVWIKIPKETGMKHEPHIAQADCLLIMKDGSEISTNVQFHVESKYREVDKMPWWAPWFF